MKKYIVRSLKYFFALCVLCIALMGLMLMTGTSALSLDDTLYVMLHTDRYLMLFAAIVALAAVYPRFGFVVRRVEGDIEENREQILNAFRSAGFSLRSDEDGVMTFRQFRPEADAAGRRRDKGFTVRTMDRARRHPPRRRPGAVPARFVYTHDTQ